ncbi:MAG: VOC family protein [Pirellulaceae bacterium]
MENSISNMIAQYESGQMNRRELVASVSALVAVVASGTRLNAAPLQEEEPDDPVFLATGLNHIALQVTDVPRSRDFYIRHLGLSVRSDNGDRSCFLNCGKHFVALFRSETPQMDHYCYSIDDYDVDRCEALLKAQGIEPRVVRPDGRIYFPDPDGLTVQLAQTPR